MRRTGNRIKRLMPLKRSVFAVLVIGAFGLAATNAAYGVDPDTSANRPLGDLPLNPEWLANTLTRATTTTSVKNNTSPETIARRDEAVAQWKAAVAQAQPFQAQAKAASASAAAASAKAKKATAKVKALKKALAKAGSDQKVALRAKLKKAKRAAKAAKQKAAKAAQAAKDLQQKAAGPNPLAKPEYSVVWSGKQNAADVNADVISKFISNATVNPQGLLDMLNPQFLPGLDGWQVIDMRKFNIDGSQNIDYGKVVNFVQLPLPWGIETEAHHMQYQWEDGQPIIAGALFTSATFVMGVDDIPNMNLENIINLAQTPQGSIPDAYDAVNDGSGRFIGTYMGGPVATYGLSPGEVVTFKPDPEKGLVVDKETPAGSVGGVLTGNAGGVPEPCSIREARPLGTCANPHGIQIRQDLNRMVTADYAEPAEIILDPLKTIDKYAFRPTVRTWDTSDPSNPKLVSVANMPDGPLKPAQRAHEQYGIMEDAKTWPKNPDYPGMVGSNGMFAGSMCGGGIFFTPDITKLEGDSSSKFQEVWNDGLSNLAENGGNEFTDEPGGCAGGAWHQVSPNNETLFRSVQGRNPGGDNYFDQGASKMLYDIDIKPLIASAQDGKVQCDLARGTDVNGDGSIDLTGIQTFDKLAKGETVADCPRLISTLKVNDPTSGGPHWAALDNHSLTADGAPTRLVFSDYFVARTGVDGDHRFYAVNIDPSTQKLSYDEDFRDENTGALGVNFNRRDWPGSPDAGFYKPHSMVWVCPPGICPKD
jgi:hypothetical protein